MTLLALLVCLLLAQIEVYATRAQELGQVFRLPGIFDIAPLQARQIGNRREIPRLAMLARDDDSYRIVSCVLRIGRDGR